jgi:hypothetical protein
LINGAAIASHHGQAVLTTPPTSLGPSVDLGLGEHHRTFLLLIIPLEVGGNVICSVHPPFTSQDRQAGKRPFLIDGESSHPAKKGFPGNAFERDEDGLCRCGT